MIDSLPRRWFSVRNLVMAAAAALVVWAVAATVIAGRAGKTGTAVATGKTGNRIAVLPFQNQGASTDEYFADGIADEVRGKLSRVKRAQGDRVVERQPVQGQHQEPAGDRERTRRRLPARVALCVGRPPWDGKRRVQVVPELIDAGSGDVKWQQSFDTDITDVFEVQSQIATRVAGALGVALGGSEQQQVTKRPTDNVEAYQLYLKGRAVAGADPASLRESAAYLEQAVALDSTFADAWAALCISLSRLYSNGFASTITAQRAKEALGANRGNSTPMPRGRTSRRRAITRP